MSLILIALYFFLPAYFANMAPSVFKFIPWSKYPINKRLFGNNKSWQGIIIAILTGTLIFWLQKLLYTKGFTSLALIKYTDFSVFLGALMGAGAIIGDLIESYYKRKRDIPSGSSWMPWDQLDFVFGGILFIFFVYIPPISIILILLIASPILHIATNYVGYLLKINKNKF